MDNDELQVDRIKIEYFTDPLCSWSWAFEPHWRKFINEHKHLVNWKYRMGGMIKDWKSYNDPFNDVSRPAQMGPLWLQVKHATGIEINPQIWIEDPPVSSIPSCMAVKCAEMQSAAAGDLMLTLLRKAVMVEGRNIAKTETIFELAQQAGNKYKLLDYTTFISNWGSKALKTLIKEDFQKAKLMDIGRFPTITIQSGDGTGIILVGYRPYSVLMEAFNFFMDKQKEKKVKLKLKH